MKLGTELPTEGPLRLCVSSKSKELEGEQDLLQLLAITDIIWPGLMVNEHNYYY